MTHACLALILSLAGAPRVCALPSPGEPLCPPAHYPFGSPGGSAPAPAVQGAAGAAVVRVTVTVQVQRRFTWRAAKGE